MSWLNPHLERFTPSTNLNANLLFDKLPTPTYTMVLKKTLTAQHDGLQTKTIRYLYDLSSSYVLGIIVYLCDFHREQAWLRWIRVSKHGCQKIEKDLLPMLRSIARSTTENQYSLSVQILQSSSVWKISSSNLLRKCFQSIK